jgi:LacI family transcriptional regulator
MPTTIRDVARAASVSVASASRALNGHASVTPETRAKVVEAARQLDYVPHLGARSLSTRRSNTIGVVLPDLFGEFFSEIIRGIDKAAHRRGLQLLLSNMHGSALETASALRAMRGRVDGLLVMSSQLDAEFLARNLPKGLPAVVMNGRIEGANHAAIVIDNQTGAHAAVAHLVAQGCRNIAHLAGPAGNGDAEERAQGFRKAMHEMLGIGDPMVLDGDFSEEAGIAAGRQLTADVDGVFSANDMMAIGCIAALTEAGRNVPDDVAVVGFDDVPIARYVTPALSTMRVHIAELGERALERLVQTLEADAETNFGVELLVPELVVRASSRREPRQKRQ